MAALMIAVIAAIVISRHYLKRRKMPKYRLWHKKDLKGRRHDSASENQVKNDRGNIDVVLCGCCFSHVFRDNVNCPHCGCILSGAMYPKR